MRKTLIIILSCLLSLFLVSCGGNSDSVEQEPTYQSSDLAWYEMLGDWEQVNGDNYLELYDDDTFYDSRYDLSGTWGESDGEGDVAFYYDEVPSFIIDQGWDEAEQYYEWYSYDYSQDVLFDSETNEAKWRKQ